MKNKLKDTYYFSHDSNARNDEKILKMRAVYGYEGYGIYWAIIEMLRDSSDGKLNINFVNALSIAVNFDSEKLKKFIDDCINLFELFILEGDKYHSNRLLRNIKKYKQISSKRSAIAKQMHSNKTKLNKTKLNKTKLNKTTLDFEKFWILYDKKTGNKSKLFKIWEKLKEKEKEIIFRTLPDYVISTPDKKFRKNPQTYLNQESWNDEIIISNNGTYKPKDLEPEKF